MKYYLGLDCSTQSFKAIVINPTNTQEPIVGEVQINYGKDLPEYKSPDGYLTNSNPTIIHSNPLMWLAALDLVFEKLQQQIDLAKIAAIGGCAQQHATVYLNKSFINTLNNLKNNKYLAEQLTTIFSRASAPIWMDSSTACECEELSQILGEYIKAATGSPATMRFAAPQIRAFFKHFPQEYKNTSHIHLASSFLCSILAGKSAPIDYGDGAGMNLVNLQNSTWDKKIAEVVSEDLINCLPLLSPNNNKVGNINPYFYKYGFSKDTAIYPWTGDNPASLIGCGVFSKQTAVISLGTSDTFFAPLVDINKFSQNPQAQGNIFGNPAGGFMSLICFKNGALVRDFIRQKTQVSWEYFATSAFTTTPAGNNDKFILPWQVAEITPVVGKEGIIANFDFNRADINTQIRAVVESQIMAIYTHSQWIGKFEVLRVTGGGSQSLGILQTIADIFQCKVETIVSPNATAIGGAMLVASFAGGFPLSQLAEMFCKAKQIITPNHIHKQTYKLMADKYINFEREQLSLI